jgi:hypothetical protein
MAMTIFATEAQSKKSTAKKNNKSHISAETKANAEFAKVQLEKKQIRDQQLADQLKQDSTMKEDERLAEEKKDMDRIVWKEQKLKEVDSLNQLKWKQQSEDREKGYAAERSQNEIIKAAKLSDNQGRKVKIINQAFVDKATVVKQSAALTEDEKKQQIASLNEERRSKLKTALGNNKERKLEKERIEYSK